MKIINPATEGVTNMSKATNFKAYISNVMVIIPLVVFLQLTILELSANADTQQEKFPKATIDAVRKDIVGTWSYTTNEKTNPYDTVTHELKGFASFDAQGRITAHGIIIDGMTLIDGNYDSGTIKYTLGVREDGLVIISKLETGILKPFYVVYAISDNFLLMSESGSSISIKWIRTSKEPVDLIIKK